MGMSTYESLVNEIIALIEEKGAYKGIEKLEALRTDGNSDAITCLGELYLEGIGVIADTEIGLNLLQEASGDGNPHADEILGKIYLFASFGVPEDLEKGHDYIERAAKANLPGAIGICACDYYYGNGVIQDCEKGMDWAFLGAKLGDLTSHALCGDAYISGNGISQDISKASYHYRQVLDIDPENTDAMCDLALCLSDPTNEYNVFPSQADLSDAFNLLSKAVEMGDVRAHYLLGIMYANGVGVSQDFDLAHRYVELAANNGFEPAQESLNQFRRTMRGAWTI